MRKKLGDRLAKGHNWVFASEVASLSASVANGAMVQVFTAAGSCVGTGFAATNSSIGVRLFSREQQDYFDPKPLITSALAARIQMGIPIPRCLFHGDADGISGLNILEYATAVILQSSTAGIDNFLPEIEAIVATALAKPVYWHQNSRLRQKEGVTMMGDKKIEATWMMGNVRYSVDSLDALLAFNFAKATVSAAITQLAIKGLVWDLFCGNGSLGIAAAACGAQVLAIDNDTAVLQQLRQIAELNQLAIQTQLANVFDFLKAHPILAPQLIILDPPAFAIKDGLAAYKAINLNAMRQQRRAGGWLLSGYNTSTVLPHHFLEMIQAAAHDAKVRYTIFRHIEQRADWPIAAAYPHTHLFHFWLIRVNAS